MLSVLVNADMDDYSEQFEDENYTVTEIIEYMIENDLYNDFIESLEDVNLENITELANVASMIGEPHRQETYMLLARHLTEAQFS